MINYHSHQENPPPKPPDDLLAHSIQAIVLVVMLVVVLAQPDVMTVKAAILKGIVFIVCLALITLSEDIAVKFKRRSSGVKQVIVDFESGESDHINFDGSNITAISQVLKRNPDKQPTFAVVYLKKNNSYYHHARYKFQGKKAVRTYNAS